MGGAGVVEAEKSLPPLVGTMPDPHSRDVGKKAASHWVEVAGGAGVDKTTHSPPFFPRPELEEEKEGEQEEEEGSGKGAEEEEEEVEDLGRLCKTRPDKDCPINTRVPARTRLFQPLSLLQATPPPSPAKTLDRHFSSADFSSQPKIGHHCQQTDSALASDVFYTCYFVVWSGCVDHEG